MTLIRFLETSLRKKIFQSLQNYSTLMNKKPKRIFETYVEHIQRKGVLCMVPERG